MKVLVACEFTGTVRRAFEARGHEAWSCDILPAEDGANQHYQCDIISLLQDTSGQWDLIIAHPPCTYLSASGLHWNGRTPGRAAKTWEAIRFVEKIWRADCPRVAIENPRGCLSTFSELMKPAQVVQPYDYGHDASKETCLWLKGLAPLVPTGYVCPRIVNGKKRWSNQTDSGQNKLPPSETRSADRSRTYQGIADAMAKQWGVYERTRES